MQSKKVIVLTGLMVMFFAVPARAIDLSGFLIEMTTVKKEIAKREMSVKP